MKEEFSKDQAGFWGVITALFWFGNSFFKYLANKRAIKQKEESMEKDIIDGNIGAVGSYDIEFKQGKLTAKVGVGHSGVSGNISLEFNSDAIIDALCKAIPGQIDDALGAILKNALKA